MPLLPSKLAPDRYNDIQNVLPVREKIRGMEEQGPEPLRLLQLVIKVDSRLVVKHKLSSAT